MKAIDSQLLTRLIEEARSAPRRRKNLNLHCSDQARCHRLLNAIEPGSYIRPHRHLDPEKGETMVLLTGRLGAILFDDAGQVQETLVISRESGVLAVDFPAGSYHTVLALEPGTVFLEAKAGPYLPLSPEEAAPWAPGEGEEGWEACLQHFMGLVLACGS